LRILCQLLGFPGQTIQLPEQRFQSSRAVHDISLGDYVHITFGVTEGLGIAGILDAPLGHLNLTIQSPTFLVEDVLPDLNAARPSDRGDRWRGCGAALLLSRCWQNVAEAQKPNHAGCC
jgi:hypothetical protein